jgi:hypothetical protein
MVHHAVDYLARKGMVELAQIGNQTKKAHITDSGIDCVENFGGRVSEYLRDQNNPKVSATFNAPVHDSNLAWGNENATQRISHGIDTEALAQILAAVRQAAPALTLVEADQAELTTAVEAAEEELSDDEPQPGRLRALMSRIAGVLGRQAESALATTLQRAVNEGLDQIGLPPGTA